jgi:NTE family protein
VGLHITLQKTWKKMEWKITRRLIKWRQGLKNRKRKVFGLNKKRILMDALLLAFSLTVGCAHYPVNQPIKEIHLDEGYRAASMKNPENSDSLLMYLTFSGGGMRAAALSYGVLEKLRKTEIVVDGRKRRLLDEVDGISSVSGASFTAGYYGLFGDRIFKDFESKFLKKNIQRGLVLRALFNVANWVRLFSPTFARSDLAAGYYDKHIFEGGTFGDIAARKGPFVIINATDMTHGIRVGFTQEAFDLICSDLSHFSVARAAAASSAIPMALTPILLRNYAGTCGFKIAEGSEKVLEGSEILGRQFYLHNDIAPFLDAEKKPYIHLVDGGVGDNLGLKAVLDRVILKGSVWGTMKGTPMEKVRKVVFIVVNAETKPDPKWDKTERVPTFGVMLASYSSVAIDRYNEESIALLQESVGSWTNEIKTERCKGGAVSTSPGSCGDIQFYVVEVKFDGLKDETERMHFKRLPTALKLSPEEVDKTRGAAHRILAESGEFQRLLLDLK